MDFYYKRLVRRHVQRALEHERAWDRWIKAYNGRCYTFCVNGWPQRVEHAPKVRARTEQHYNRLLEDEMKIVAGIMIKRRYRYAGEFLMTRKRDVVCRLTAPMQSCLASF